MRKTVWWAKSNFLGLLLECGKDQWDCDVVIYYVAHRLLTSCDARSQNIVFQFWLDKGTIRCGNNFWSDFLRSIVLGFSTSGNAVFTSQEHVARTEVTYSLLDSMNCLAMGHGYYIIYGLAAFTEHGFIHSPSTMMGSHRQPKNGKQTCWVVKEASKAFYRYPRAVVNGKSYTCSLFLILPLR